ncbi:hypothetical protein [Thiohalomonas denitrificans]|uniref:hypothetical protein n=1 Tax=Thiohalomonas denitrificans TaxID=415747 RepID=UPI001113C7C6|nr:hypothetical protein [Thiohalomonas denitrificans]
MNRLADTPGHTPSRCHYRRGWAVLLFAAALLVVQSGLFGHELEHLSSDSDEAACEICLAGGGLAHTHSTPPSPHSLPHLSGVAPKASTQTPLIARWISGYQGRAPPVSG